MTPKYSVCITHYNNVMTVESSLTSILDQIDDRFEVVVVDQGSTDGSLEVLERLAQERGFQLHHQDVRNRGLGRQLAFTMSKGECIIAQIDMDDIYQPVIRQLVTLYESVLTGMVLRVVNSQKRGAVTVAPRSFLEDVGGWPDLDYVEDRWIWGRAVERGIYRWSRFPLYSKITESREKRGFLSRAIRVYGIQRDRIRIGASPHLSISTWPVYPFSYIAARKAQPIGRSVFRDFWPDDPKYCVDELTQPMRA
jgi:glycosyltransferase involved in cell wall biosynthesis